MFLTISNNHFFNIPTIQDNNVLQTPGAFFIMPPLDADVFHASIDIHLGPSPIFMDGLTTDSQEFTSRVASVDEFSAAAQAVAVKLWKVCKRERYSDDGNKIDFEHKGILD
jgi:hypothetical protein